MIKISYTTLLIFSPYPLLKHPVMGAFIFLKWQYALAYNRYNMIIFPLYAIYFSRKTGP